MGVPEAACTTVDTGCQGHAIGLETSKNMLPFAPEPLKIQLVNSQNRFKKCSRSFNHRAFARRKPPADAASNLEAGSTGRQVKARVSRRSESNVWHYGLPAAGPIRPSLPWYLSAAVPSLDPNCARRKTPTGKGKV